MRSTIDSSKLRTRSTGLLFRFWREIGGFSQARIAFLQKLKSEFLKRHFWIFSFLKKSSVEFLFEEGSLFFGNHTVIIVLSTGELKSIFFKDRDRISKMLWLCDPKSDPVQVFCILQNTCNWM